MAAVSTRSEIVIHGVFLDFFRALESRGIESAVLHSYEDLPEKVSSDVDFVVHPDGWGELVRIQARVASSHGWVVAQVLRHETTACYSVLINPGAPEQFLKLDACTDYVCEGRRFIRAGTLLAGRREVRGFHVAAPGAECVYRLAKAVHKSKPADEVLPVIAALAKAAPDETQAAFAEVFGRSRPLQAWLSDGVAGWSSFSAAISAAGVPFRRKDEWLRRLRRLARPTGLRLSLLGSDGAGKSTLLANLRKSLGACFRREAVFHFRPRAFEKPRESAPITQPHAQAPRSVAAGWMKTLYYFADHLLGHWLRVRPSLVRSTLVVFDRDFSDLIVDPVRFRLCGSRLARLLLRWVPKSNVSLILDADPAVLRARKPELSETELARQRAVFARLAATLPEAHMLDAALPPQTLAGQAARLVLAVLARRTAAREGIPFASGGAGVE